MNARLRIFAFILLMLGSRSLKKLDRDLQFSVDLDAEQGQGQGRPDGKRTNVFRVVIRPTKEVNIMLVQELLRGNTTIKTDALECLSEYRYLHSPVVHKTDNLR